MKQWIFKQTKKTHGGKFRLTDNELTIEIKIIEREKQPTTTKPHISLLKALSTFICTLLCKAYEKKDVLKSNANAKIEVREGNEAWWWSWWWRRMIESDDSLRRKEGEKCNHKYKNRINYYWIKLNMWKCFIAASGPTLSRVVFPIETNRRFWLANFKMLATFFPFGL